ncbi:MAG: cytochrome c3 family protein, partial [Planctomycetota bacterium]
CHLEKQGEWLATGHATAWESLQSNEGAQEFCEACHTVNSLGNYVVGDAGHVATGDERYQDVQCESCHGPGLEHVLDPKAETIPLASMFVGNTLSNGCGQCHQGTHHPYVEEWEESRHGSINVFPASQEGCDQCHTGEGALAAWGIDADYIGKASLSEPGEHMAITCAVCHDPHGGSNHAQLRFPLDVASYEQNLCMKCHQERATPDPMNERGPHAPEGPTLLGYAGWRPATLAVTEALVGTHGNPDQNPTLCARCHAFSFGVSDGVYATGHVFSSIPCLNSDGTPNASGDCEDSDRTFQACTGSGCHSSEDDASAARSGAVTRMESLVTELRALIDEVPRSEFDTDDHRYTVAEGARFNAVLGEYTGSAVHNPFLIEALLLSSIEAVETTYGLTAAASLIRAPLFGLD